MTEAPEVSGTSAPAIAAPRAMLFWVALLAGLGVAVWLLSSILAPFVLGMAIAYFVDPLVGRLERLGPSRAVVSAGIIVTVFGVSTLGLLLVAPVLLAQVTNLAERLPALVTWGYQALLPVANRLMERVGAPSTALQAPPTVEILQRAATIAGDLLKRLLADALALVNLLSLLCLTPLVAFYLLRDWPRMIAEVDGWLPRPHADRIREEVRKIDVVLAGFARGSAIVCVMLGAFYAIGLTAVGLQFGLIIGLTAGALSFVPYLGVIFCLVSSVGVALYQFWPHWPRIAVVAGVCLTGEIVQDYLLAPRLIGQQVGLHPLWVMFGVLAGGALFGFVGVLLAVPACAVIGVLVRSAMGRYKRSPLYAGGIG